MNYSDYILDFSKVNELTSHPNDNPNAPGFIPGSFCYNITRKAIRLLIEEYLGFDHKKQDTERYQIVCDTLYYNNILVHKNEIRNKQLEKVTND